MEQTKETSYFGTAPIGGLIAKFAIPSVISLLVNALYNIVDQIFIGRGVGYLGNGATSVVFPITVVALAIALLFGDGGAAYLSLKLGEGNHKKAEKGVGNSIVMLTITGIVLLVISLVFLKPLLTLFGGTEAIMPYAISYGRIIAIGLPFVVISTGLNSMIRADGNPKAAMISMITGAVINTVLDPVFIFICKWGVAGAALATILGQIASFAISVFYLFKLRSVKISKECLKLDKGVIGSCCGLGISSFITQIAIVIASALCNNLFAQYGAASKYGADIPITVIGIVMKVNQIMISILIGISTGAQPILGYNYGAGNISRVKKTYRIMLTACLIVGAVAFILFEFFPQAIISIFGSEGELYNEFAVLAFRIFLMMCILTAYQIASSIFLQAIGKSVMSMISVLLRQLIIFVPVAIIMPKIIGVTGVLWAGPVADFGATVVTLFMIIPTLRKMKGDKAHE